MKLIKTFFFRLSAAIILCSAALTASILCAPEPTDSIEAYLHEIYGSNSVRCIGGEYYEVIYRPIWDDDQQTFVPGQKLYSFSAPDSLEAYTGPFYSLAPASPTFEYGEDIKLELRHHRRGTSYYSSQYQLDYFSGGNWYTLNPSFSYGNSEIILRYGETHSRTLSSKTLAQAKLYDSELGEYIIEDRDIPLRKGRYRYSLSVYEKGAGKEYLLACEFEIV